MPNLLPRSMLGFELGWLRPAGRLIWFSLVFVIGIVIAYVMIRRTKPSEETTWAAAMAGAVAVSAMMFLGYAVIPHEWLKFADGYLKWNLDRLLIKQGGVTDADRWWSFRGNTISWIPIDNPLRFELHMRAIRDVVVTTIYIAFVGLNFKFWSLWQHRGEPKEEKVKLTEETVRTSRFGRPLRKRKAVTG